MSHVLFSKKNNRYEGGKLASLMNKDIRKGPSKTKVLDKKKGKREPFGPENQ